MIKLIAEPLDPEWTCFVRCPYCHLRTFGCCDEHAIEGMNSHIDELH